MLPPPNSRTSKFNQGEVLVSSLSHPEKYVGKIKKIRIMSSWEMSFLKFCDRTPEILQYRSEEDIILYKHPIDGRTHRYFMDFWIKAKTSKGKTREMLIEIKPWKEAQPWLEKTDMPNLTEGMSKKTKMRVVSTYAQNKAKWDAAKIHAKKRNQIFAIFTERDIMFNKPK